MSYKWRPSRKSAREFKEKMDEVEEFCKKNNISSSSSQDSYYFTLKNKSYRVSNHAVEKSHYKDVLGNNYNYHGDSNDYKKNTICIFASKKRLIKIYNDIKSGYKVDGRGYRK